MNLDLQQILNKEFNVDFKGYSASEVDSFLDLVLEDYQSYDGKFEELNKLVEDLKHSNASLKAHIIELEGKQKAIDLSNTTSFSSVDLLKRVSRLEQEIQELKNK